VREGEGCVRERGAREGRKKGRGWWLTVGGMRAKVLVFSDVLNAVDGSEIADRRSAKASTDPGPRIQNFKEGEPMTKWKDCGVCGCCTEGGLSDCSQPVKIEAALYVLSVDVYGDGEEIPDTHILAAVPCLDRAAQIVSNYEANKGLNHVARDEWFTFGIDEIGTEGLVIDSYRVENNGGILFRTSV